MPGGFHPFHAGHMSLYNSARRVFPDAEVYVAATNDTSSRPFPFAVKEKLAKLAGVEAGHFVQVSSPFRAAEITSKYNPEQDVLIFVRSEKDANSQPQPGGVKKDGSPSYLQPLLGARKLEPFAKHAYMAYLPTVEFGPGMTSATQIRSAWPSLDERRKTALVMSLYPKTQTSPQLAATVVKLLDAAIGGEQGVAEDTDKEGYHTRVRRGDFRPSKYGEDEYNYLHDLMNTSGDSSGPQLVTINDKKIARQIATMYGADVENTGMGTYRIVQRRGDSPMGNKRPKLTGMAEAAKKCPPATQDITINLNNRQKAINEYGYGPLNPDLPNTKFWMKKVDEWNLDSMEEAQSSLCGNCAAFDIRQDTLDCIAQGIDSDSPEDAEGVIDAGDLGYCKFLKFKCASRRTCDAWVTGGPLADKPVDENQGWAATYETNAQNFVGGMKAGYQARENQPVGEEKPHDITDPELKQSKRFAKQHYPEFSGDEDLAFDKWVQRSLGHSEQEDAKHAAAIRRLSSKITDLQRQVQQVQSDVAAAPVQEDSDYIEEKWSAKYKSSINCANPKGFSQKAHCAGRKK